MVSDGEGTVVEIHLSPGDGRDAAHGRRSMVALGAFMGARLLMDRAYEGDPTRLLAESFGPGPVVPPERNRTIPWECDRDAYRGVFLCFCQLCGVLTCRDSVRLLWARFALPVASGVSPVPVQAARAGSW